MQIAYKKNTISGIQHCKQTFAKHLMLHESHCEQILIEIETLVNKSQQASYIDRKFDLYCLLLIILLDTLFISFIFLGSIIVAIITMVGASSITILML